MEPTDIRGLRLHHQKITFSELKTPTQVVRYMGAMQAQEYAMAKWAVGLRGSQIVAEDVENAFNRGELLRTHLLRPTWHFVTPEDIGWITRLSAPHVQRINASQYRKNELDERLLHRACELIYRALEGSKQLTRTALAERLRTSGIEAKGQRLAYIMMHAELSCVVTSGAKEGKQFTYALFSERVPGKCNLCREELLVKLAERYFASRGPATVQDFAYWSGLTLKDARAGAVELDSRFVKEGAYIFVPLKQTLPIDRKGTFLMPDYDEYGMSYKDRSVLLSNAAQTAGLSDYSHWLVYKGMIAGTWQIGKRHGEATLTPFSGRTLSDEEQREALERYRQFWGGKNEAQ